MPGARGRKPAPQQRDAFAAACEAFERVLEGDTRSRILEHLGADVDPLRALLGIREAMRRHAFTAGSRTFDLHSAVRALDSRTRADGFNVLEAWDPNLHRFSSEITPVLMVEYVARARIARRPGRETLAILLDVYLLYLLSLLAMRVWDTGDADANLDRVGEMLRRLQGPGGSGQQFVDDAATLILLAMAQYQPDERCYDILLAKVRTLAERHQLDLARIGAPVLGSHLRWGFRLMYGSDPETMRADNVVDYPWLLYCVSTLLRRYEVVRDGPAGGEEFREVVGALLNGFSCDPWAFLGETPACLVGQREEHRETRSRLAGLREPLLRDVEDHRPSGKRYSPIAFDFNFMHNMVVARIACSLLDARAGTRSLNALFRCTHPGDEVGAGPLADARRLVEYSGAHRVARGDRGVLVTYDPFVGRRSFETAVSVLRKGSGGAADIALPPRASDRDAGVLVPPGAV